MIKILITGSSGFIGRNLVEYLSGRYSVFAPSHQELDLLNGIKVREYIKRKGIRYIIHGANVGGGRDTLNQKDVIGINLRMFFNIVRNEDLVERIIHFGSGAEYDKSKDLKKVSEEDFDKFIPKDDYGFYKYVCAKYIRIRFGVNGTCRESIPDKASKSHHFVGLKDREALSRMPSFASPVIGGNLICLRLFGVYGKYENYLFKFISNTIVKNLLHQPIVIGQNVNFDYLYITDLCRIVEYFLENKGKYADYNVATGQKNDLITIAKLVNKICGFESEIIIRNKGLNLEYTADNSRLEGEIRNFRFTSLGDGIKDLYGWYKLHLREIDKKEVLEDPYIKLIKVNK